MRIGRVSERPPIRTHAEHSGHGPGSDQTGSGARDDGISERGRCGNGPGNGGLGDNGMTATLEAETAPPKDRAGKDLRTRQGNEDGPQGFWQRRAGRRRRGGRDGRGGQGRGRGRATIRRSVRPRRFTVVTDEARDALLTDFGKDTLTDRYLLPGENYQDLFARVADCLRRRRGARAAALRLHLEAVVHAGDPGAVERRHQPRPADQLLPQLGLRQPRRHRRHLERERLARQHAAAASAPTGATCAGSASRSASTARPAASSRSCG